MDTINLKTTQRNQFIDISQEIARAIKARGIKNGLCHIYVPHTTAAITINENADRSVVADILDGLNRFAPRDLDYRHKEGNADAHIKASLLGSSAVVLIEDGALALGTWQGIFFCEFDGPRQRRVLYKIVED